MTEIVAAGFAFAMLVVVVACTFFGRTPPRTDVDEDIQAPSLEVIEDALRHVGADNRGAQDWLLDRWLLAKERATNGS